MTKYVIRPLQKEELKKFFDSTAKKTIQYFISKALFAQPELVEGQSNLPIHVPKEHIEQWIVQALNVVPVGAGNYAIDVVKKTEPKWGADVKMLSCKIKAGKLTNGESGETSLAQKFTGAGNELDTLFTGEKYEEIVTEFVQIYSEKLSKVVKEENLKKIYYFFLLRAGTKFYVCGMEVLRENLKNVKYLRNTKDSVWTKYFLEDKYGSVRVYKAKKRIELRLRPKQWYDDELLIEFETKGEVPVRNIASIINSQSKLKNHFEFMSELFLERRFGG